METKKPDAATSDLNERLGVAKPCPFCGSTDLGIGRQTEDREGCPTYIYCEDCGAHGPWMYVRDDEILNSTNLCAATTGWNKRLLPEQRRCIEKLLELVPMCDPDLTRRYLREEMAKNA